MPRIDAASEQVFGDYELVARLATGGMAEIFLARQKGLGGFQKIVVIKRILPHLAAESEFVQLFLDEARIAADLNHPNIVQIYDLGELQGAYYIAMEYLPGVTLAAIYSRARERGLPVPAEIGAGLIVQACRGLHYAHERTRGDGTALSLVHRDVSPQNLIVTFDGVTKLVDFGIAKAAGKTVQTESGMIRGKLSYMSPEQLHGQPLDRRADLFALGVVLWELLAGRRLFDGDSEPEVIRAVTSDEIQPLTSWRPDLPAALDEAVQTGLERDARKRFPTALAFEESLIRAMRPAAPASEAELARYLRESFAVEMEAQAELLEQVESSQHAPQKLIDASALITVARARLAQGGSSEGSSAPRPAPQPPGTWSAGHVAIRSDDAFELRKQPALSVPGEGEGRNEGQNGGRNLRRWLFVLAGALVGLVILLLLVGRPGAPSDHAPVTVTHDGHEGPGHAGTGSHTGPVGAHAAPVLVVESDPTGAEVFVEGVAGPRRAPARFEGLPTGVRRQIRVTHPGRRPWVGVVTLEAGKPALRLRVPLKPR